MRNIKLDHAITSPGMVPVSQLLKAEQSLEMVDGCLDMIREALAWTGEDMSRTPAMAYDDAIRISWSKQSVRAEKAEIERDLLLDTFGSDELRNALVNIRTKQYEDGNSYREAVKTLLDYT